MKLIFYVLLLLNITCAHKKIDHDHHGMVHHPHTPGEMNKKFLDPNLKVEPWVSEFEDPTRDVVIHREAILKSLKLKKAESVVDVGAGTGIFLKGLSDKVGPKGKVVGLDISPQFIKFMQSKIQSESLKNTKAMLGELSGTKLPDNSFDMVFCVDTFHHFDDPPTMLLDFRRILKNKGRLVIIDFLKKEDSRDWVKHHINMSKEQYIEQITKQGFKLLEDSTIPFKENFMLTFERLK